MYLWDETYSFDEWYELNKDVLKDLYFKLINISKSYNIIIKNDRESINNFLIMMYNESNKTAI